MQAAAIEVAKKPANPDLEFIPHGQTKMNISNENALVIASIVYFTLYPSFGHIKMAGQRGNGEQTKIHTPLICHCRIRKDQYPHSHEGVPGNDWLRRGTFGSHCIWLEWLWVTYLDEIGHVRTLDPKILGSCILMAIIEKGLNHITPKPLQIAKIITKICEAWDRIASIIPNVYICNWPSNEAAVKQHINYRVRMVVQNSQTTPTVEVMTTPEAQRQLEWVHKHLYISDADKVANTPTFFCKMLAHGEALG
ncbi:hypothetical protein SELMODRAFT_403841 [Selaginella moellendorffii]|uniref:Uncharacterized protein n=1 Tax=Selaginella moellendorffii TaxID=88036 RepID=D8QSQ2_SELML|nr:hypothetical protein SELMODRAFT_403841 [Selaginella moellendorffii]